MNWENGICVIFEFLKSKNPYFGLFWWNLFKTRYRIIYWLSKRSTLHLSLFSIFSLFGHFWKENGHVHKTSPKKLANWVDLLGRLLSRNNVFKIFRGESSIPWNGYSIGHVNGGGPTSLNPEKLSPPFAFFHIHLGV